MLKSIFSVVKHGKQYIIYANFPKLQVEGACEFDVKYKTFSFNESCSFVETFREQFMKWAIIPIQLDTLLIGILFLR